MESTEPLRYNVTHRTGTHNRLVHYQVPYSAAAEYYACTRISRGEGIRVVDARDGELVAERAR